MKKITRNHKHYLLLFSSEKGKDNLAKDLTLEINEEFDRAAKVINTYILNCSAIFQKTSSITHLSYPKATDAVNDLLAFTNKGRHQEVIALLRTWIASSQPERHIAISGIVYSAIKEVVFPKSLYHCVATDHLDNKSKFEILSSVKISDNGWVFENDDSDSCSLLGCVPIGDEYISWRLYDEETFVPILGFIDFCKNQQLIKDVEAWCQTHSHLPEAKILRAIQQIENIEIARNSTFI